MRPTHHRNVNPDRLLVSWCVAIKLSTKHGNWWHLLGILQEHVQFAVKRYIFIKCPRLVSFDHGLAISSRSIVSVRSRSHARVKSSPRRFWFITERITVFTNFSFEELRSADADVTGTVRRVTRIFDWPRHFWWVWGHAPPENFWFSKA
jgi:hypothetical protein